jgi:hypothetical protein
MGTRGAFGFIKNGVEKVTYNHFDSYPDGLGQNVIDFATKYLNKLNEIYDSIELVNDDTPITEDVIKHCEEMKTIRSSVDIVIGNALTFPDKSWYSLLRNAQSEGIMKYGAGLKYMSDGKDFLNDSLFCEWAYIINLDTNALEIYRGFNKDFNAKGRYSSTLRKEGDDYYGVALIGEIPLEDINTVEYYRETTHDGYTLEGFQYDGDGFITTYDERND